MMNILVVDDSRSVQAFLKSCMAAFAVNTDYCFNGRQALERLSANPESHYSLVLLDWEMPVMDGPSTLAELGRIAPSLPVIMMTTRNSPDDIRAMIEKGAKEYVLKPFTADILKEKIESVLGTDVLGKAVSRAA